MSWAKRRKATYISSFLLILFLILIIVFFVFFNKQPTCFDNIRNQGESGIDCGGPCTILCRAQYVDPNILWTRWAKVSGFGTYNVLAYSQNLNVGIGALNAPYIFSIYDKDNIMLYQKTGYTYIPPSGNFTIFEGNININDKIPARIEFNFINNFIWQKIENEESDITAVSKSLINQETRPKLLVTIKNKSLKDIKNIESIAILYDENANAIAFSKTITDILAKDSTQDITFTWPEKFKEEVYKIEIISKVLKNNVN
ncbi:MAG: hypothetical protein WCR40_01120 [Candidatus Paceibacterota bacterium]